jgi:hypothetical protein
MLINELTIKIPNKVPQNTFRKTFWIKSVQKRSNISDIIKEYKETLKELQKKS